MYVKYVSVCDCMKSCRNCIAQRVVERFIATRNYYGHASNNKKFADPVPSTELSNLTKFVLCIS